MRSVSQKQRRWKKKVTSRRRALEEMIELSQIDDIDVKVSLIQALIPLGLAAVNEKLQEEVKTLAGERYAHGKENLRWGRQNGSVYLLDQKVPMMVPRVRNKLSQAELGLSYYQKLQQPYRGAGI